MSKLRVPSAFLSSERKRRGFTLLELMIALGVIIVICSLLFAVMKGTSETAKRAQCAARLREAGLGFLQFAADTNSRVEVGYGGNVYSSWLWGAKLNTQEYIADKRVLRCPVGKVRRTFENSAWPWDTYAMNMYEHGEIDRREGNIFMWRLNFNRVPNRSEFWLLADSGEPSAEGLAQTFRVVQDNGVQGGVALYHQNRANVFFSDGHLEALSRDELVKLGCRKIHDAPKR